MDGWVQILGAALVLLALADIFLTVLYARSGTGILAPRLTRMLWWLFKRIGRALPSGGPRLMSFAGPTMLVTLVAVWTTLLVLGFALIVWPALGTSITKSQGPTPTDFATAVYYSGYSIATLGFGDIVPGTGAYRILTVLMAVSGFGVLTLSLTYLMSVYSALVARNTFALVLHHGSASTGNPAELLARLGAGGELDAAAKSSIDRHAANILELLQTHHAYPVLHYFRAPQPEYAMARIAYMALDLVALARSALDPEKYRSFVDGAALEALWGGGLRLLRETGEDFLPRAELEPARTEEKAAPRPWVEHYAASTSRLAAAGLQVWPVDQDSQVRYLSLRREWDTHVRAFAEHMAHPWRDIAVSGR